jgi:3-hydroxymyristoyl/3-hydroxydecanoyl-(acyl carrier protein) dehydratase
MDLHVTLKNTIKRIANCDDAIEADVEFSSALPIFAGHFPGRPIVPAVYQMALCRIAVEKYHGGCFSRVEHSRFLAPCVPDMLYTFKAAVCPKNGSLTATCTIRTHDVICSKIVLFYEQRADKC